MRRFVTLSVISFLIGWSSYSASGLEEPQYGSDELVGPVRNLRTEIAELSNKSGSPVEGPRLPALECSYDDSGNVLESAVYKADGTPFKRYKAAYDAGRSRLEESYFEPKGALDVRFISEYDSVARRAETTRYSSKGSVTGKTIYSFDVAGRPIEEVSFGSKGSVVERTVTVHHETGKSSESRCYDANAHLLYIIKRSYDTQGRSPEVEYYASDGRLIIKCLSNYDDKSNLVEETLDIGSSIRQWRYSYEFDSDGNWVKRKTMELVSKRGLPEFVPVAVAYRSIAYHPQTQVREKGTSARVVVEKALAEARSVLTSEAIKREAPVYPADAKIRRVSGKVVVLVIVDEFGKVRSARVAASPDKSLGMAAEAAAWRWKFYPTLKAGKPVKGVGTLDFNFYP